MAEDPEDLHVARPRSFYGVYILYNKNPKFLGSTYIGFTVNPARRIRQHNREIKGGAWRTGRGHGPWDMVLITHGFNTKLAALQFEWAWQNPHRSRRLKHLNLRQTCRQKKDGFVYALRVLSEMLNTGPWNRLSLTIQWLKQEYVHDFPVSRPPPTHMPIAYGEIKTLKAKDLEKKRKKKNSNGDADHDKENNISEGQDIQRSEEELDEASQPSPTSCDVCKEPSEEDSFNPLLHCIVDTCPFVAHLRCYSSTFLKQKMELGKYLIPVLGECPSCKEEMSWADVIKQKRYALNLDEVEDEDEDDIDEDENIGGTQLSMSDEGDEDDDFQ